MSSFGFCIKLISKLYLLIM